MEVVLQRQIQNLEKDHARRCDSFRTEVQRLQNKCSDLQEEVTFERVKVASELQHICQQFSRDGHVPIHMLQRLAERVVTEGAKLAPQTPAAAQMPRICRKRSRSSDAMCTEPDSKRHLPMNSSSVTFPSFYSPSNCSFTGLRPHEVAEANGTMNLGAMSPSFSIPLTHGHM
uniref:Uncharacterized protein n=1 Tax=Eutreptiella gymnastica TaxID=73025 RepID=A0A7S4G4B0_9EUGL